MDAFKEWWSQAPARDQLALIIGGALVALYILFMVVLKPVQEMREKEEIKINALQNSLENVRLLAARVAAQNQSSSDTAERASLESIVQSSLSSNGLQVTSMNASGDDGVRLRFEEAPFENMLKWLYEMEVSQNLRIRDLSISAGSNSGAVAVNLRLHQE